MKDQGLFRILVTCTNTERGITLAQKDFPFISVHEPKHVTILTLERQFVIDVVNESTSLTVT